MGGLGVGGQAFDTTAVGCGCALATLTCRGAQICVSGSYAGVFAVRLFFWQVLGRNMGKQAVNHSHTPAHHSTHFGLDSELFLRGQNRTVYATR